MTISYSTWTCQAASMSQFVQCLDFQLQTQTGKLKRKEKFHIGCWRDEVITQKEKKKEKVKEERTKKWEERLKSKGQKETVNVYTASTYIWTEGYAHLYYDISAYAPHQRIHWKIRYYNLKNYYSGQNCFLVYTPNIISLGKLAVTPVISLQQ